MKISLQHAPATGEPAAVEYRWDTDTAILTASVAGSAQPGGMSGSVELAGNDGSWVILDVSGGRICGVEVAVWPDVKKIPTLRVPDSAEPGTLIVPPSTKTESPGGVAVLQMDTTLVAESDATERTIHFRLGTTKPARTVRIARDILVDLDEAATLRGIWLLDVPPFPADA